MPDTGLPVSGSTTRYTVKMERGWLFYSWYLRRTPIDDDAGMGTESGPWLAPAERGVMRVARRMIRREQRRRDRTRVVEVEHVG